MVDLVKIRKKAKKNAEAGEQQAASGERDKPVIPSPSAPLRAGYREGPGREGGAQREADAGGRAAASGEQQGTNSDPRPTTSEQRTADSDQRPATTDQRAAPSATGELLELLTFLIAGEQYAIDIEHIVEIVPPRDVTRVPNADDSIVGIISLRGTIVTIVDVRRRLRHGSSAADRPRGGATAPEARVVVVQYGSETVGFEVDRVLRVVKVDRAAVEPHPVVHSSEESEAIRGVFRQANALTILLDFDKLLDARHGTHL